MSISFILVTFLFQLAVGMMVTVSFLPPKLVDPRFFKSISFWGFLFILFGLLLQHESVFQLPANFAVEEGSRELLARAGRILFFFFGAVTFAQWFHLRFFNGNASRPGLLFISSVGILAVITDAFLFRPNIPPLLVQNIVVPLQFLSASLLLGGFLAGMIFGHWYLVNTEMPKRLLVTMAWILIGVLILRVLSVGTTLLCFEKFVYPEVSFLNNLVSFQGHGIFFWQRVLVGLLIPAIVVGMIWSTARIGSNQSATGIMYVAIAFVFIGELAARYLFLLSAIPL
ncbi:MAG: hypothetical protein HYT76_02905 [Deltaproteobacteria bacterium]|nr:hypothetical protein [Deltaproteobacteria bacterium]